MCGFVGFTGSLPVEQKYAALTPMMQRIVHRGPDMAGQYADDDVALGFRRLSIIDLREVAAQPMANEDETVYVVYNGEVYNFQEIREGLLGAGHVFKSGSDAEVLVHGWEQYGRDIVNKLRGMFAFAIWDKRQKCLFAARDGFGIKPFYYAPLPDGNLLFGSEIKAFLDHPGFVKEVNPAALRPYLSLQYSPGDETFFKGVFSLAQGHTLFWQGGKLATECFWDPAFYEDDSKSFGEWADTIDEAVRESVQAHKISDVPVGSFLSGGVDSSYITACLMPENTFSVGFADENFDESGYAVELSKKLGVRNFRKHITPEECFEAFPAIQYHMDQPQANPSSVPLWFLAKLAREQVTVVLSGEGADELFAGYELYADTPAMEKFKRVVPAGLRRALGAAAKKMPAFKGRNFLLKSSGRPEDWFIGQADVFSDAEARRVLAPAWREGPSALELMAPLYARVQDCTELRKKQYLDLHKWMPDDINLKADRMCMAHSLELRVPFLDRRVMAVASRIPSKYLIQGVGNKVVFRAAANKTLPDEWATRPKKGFPVPIRNWLRQKQFYDVVKGYFASDYAAEFFDREAIVRLLDEHYSGKKNNGRKVWVVFTFLTWYKRFFIDETA